MYKIHHQDIAVPIPEYIQRQTVSRTHQHHPAKFRVMRPSTNVYKFSFFPRTILDRNELPPSLLESSKLSFKSGLSTVRCFVVFVFHDACKVVCCFVLGRPCRHHVVLDQTCQLYRVYLQMQRCRNYKIWCNFDKCFVFPAMKR